MACTNDLLRDLIAEALNALSESLHCVDEHLKFLEEQAKDGKGSPSSPANQNLGKIQSELSSRAGSLTEISRLSKEKSEKFAEKMKTVENQISSGYETPKSHILRTPNAKSQMLTDEQNRYGRLTVFEMQLDVFVKEMGTKIDNLNKRVEALGNEF